MAQELMLRYLRTINDTCDVHSLIDFFTSTEAKRDLFRAKPDEIFTNYVNLNHVKMQPAQLERNNLRQGSRMRPVTPVGVPMRMFTKTFTDVRIKQKNLYYDKEQQAQHSKDKFKAFVESIETIDEEVRKEEFDATNIDIGFEKN